MTVFLRMLSRSPQKKRIAGPKFFKFSVPSVGIFASYLKGICNPLRRKQSSTRVKRLNGKIQEIKTAGEKYKAFEQIQIF